MIRSIAILSISILGLLGACAEPSSESLAECNLESCSDRCTALAGPNCNVLETSCQRRIFEAVSCVRGAGGDLPEIRTVTEEEERRERDAGTDAGFDAGTDSGLLTDGGTIGATEDPTENPIHWNKALQLLRLSAPRISSDMVDYVGGYYTTKDGRITLVNRNEPQDSDSAQRLLAHELVHALQDQNIGLRELRDNTGRSTDASLALGCLTEGEANLYEELAWTLLNGLSIETEYWDTTFEQQGKYHRDLVVSAESPYDQLWVLRYATGVRYLASAWLSGGDWAVQSIYQAPPISSLHWMLGYQANEERMQLLRQPLDCNVATLPEGFKRSFSDTLGAFGVFAFLGHNLTEDGIYQTEKSWQRALAWRQDHLEVFVGPEGETAVSWRIRFADAPLAGQIAQEIDVNAPLAVRVKQHDAEIEIFSSDSRAVHRAWKGTDPKHCPTTEE